MRKSRRLEPMRRSPRQAVEACRRNNGTNLAAWTSRRSGIERLPAEQGFWLVGFLDQILVAGIFDEALDVRAVPLESVLPGVTPERLALVLVGASAPRQSRPVRIIVVALSDLLGLVEHVEHRPRHPR